MIEYDEPEEEKGVLGQRAAEKVAEERTFGKVPSGDLSRKWNEMIVALNKREEYKFVKLSEEVQSLIPVFIDESKDLRKAENRLKSARYILVKMNSVRLSRRSLKQCKEILARNGVHINKIM